MEIELYPYKIVQRTEYSKIHVFDENGTNITSDPIGRKIMADYNDQIENENKYFEIDKEALIGVSDAIERYNVKYLFIPKDVFKLSKYALYKHDIEAIHFPYSLEILDDEACARQNIKFIKLPSSIKEIGKYCFHACSFLKKAIIDNLETLPESTFMDCKSLTEVVFPYNLKTIGKYCFNCCSSIENLSIPNTVEEILDGAFSCCDNLKEIKLPKDLKVINMALFNGCEKLASIEIPDSVYEIGRESFGKTRSLTNVVLPKNLSIVGWCPFIDSGVKSLTFNYDVEELTGSNPYGGPTNLLEASYIDTLIIGKDVKTLHYSIIRNCGRQIKNIEYNGTKEQFEEFKKNNRKLFKFMPEIENIKFLEASKDISITNEDLEK